MKPRPNIRSSYYTRLQPGKRDASVHVQRSARPSLPAVSPNAAPRGKLPIEMEGIVLENEISMDELTRFSLQCVQSLLESGKKQPAEKVIGAVIAEKLPTYVSLKAEFAKNRHAQRKHHKWTQKVVNALKPLLASGAAPTSQREELSELAVKCVEQDMQMISCVEHLQHRCAFLEEAVVQRMTQIGADVALPDALMKRLTGLVRSVLVQY